MTAASACDLHVHHCRKRAARYRDCIVSRVETYDQSAEPDDVAAGFSPSLLKPQEASPEHERDAPVDRVRISKRTCSCAVFQFCHKSLRSG